MNKSLVWFKIYQKKDNWEDIHNEVYDELSFFAWCMRYPVNQPPEFVESGACIDIQMSEYFSFFFRCFDWVFLWVKSKVYHFIHHFPHEEMPVQSQEYECWFLFVWCVCTFHFDQIWSLFDIAKERQMRRHLYCSRRRVIVFLLGVSDILSDTTI